VYNKSSLLVVETILEGQQISLDLSNLVPGLYFIRIYNDSGYNDTLKIIKTK